MDITELYIKMCEKAVEVQGAWLKKPGDFYVIKRKDGTFIPRIRINPCLGGIREESPWLNWKRKVIWLPRQDQWQEMVGEHWKRNGSYGEPLIKGLYDFAMSFGYKPFKEKELPIKSWEQLWQAFVMKNNYQKSWNGEDWKR